MKTKEYLDSIKGKVAYVVKDKVRGAELFQTYEDAIEFYEQYTGRSVIPVETEISERLFHYIETLDGGLVSREMVFSCVRKLSDYVKELEEELKAKDKTMPELTGDEDYNTVKAWRWGIRRPGESVNLYESDWRYNKDRK